jgi:hypothetical protein
MDNVFLKCCKFAVGRFANVWMLMEGSRFHASLPQKPNSKDLEIDVFHLCVNSCWGIRSTPVTKEG